MIRVPKLKGQRVERMLRILLGVGLLCALSLHARSDDFTFRVKSLYKFSAQVEFRSQDRNAAWPGGNKAFDLADDAIHEHALNCRKGENICFGAWDKGSGRPQWGRGQDGKRACSNCCWACENGRRTPVITLRTRRIKNHTIPIVSLESSEPRLVTVSRNVVVRRSGGRELRDFVSIRNRTDRLARATRLVDRCASAHLREIHPHGEHAGGSRATAVHRWQRRRGSIHALCASTRCGCRIGIVPSEQ